MGPGEGKAHWKKGSKAAPPEPRGLPATGVVSGLQEATAQGACCVAQGLYLNRPSQGQMIGASKSFH